MTPVFQADNARQSGYSGAPTLSRSPFVNACTVTHANVAGRLTNGLKVAAFARNLFDARYIQNLPVRAGSRG